MQMETCLLFLLVGEFVLVSGGVSETGVTVKGRFLGSLFFFFDFAFAFH